MDNIPNLFLQTAKEAAKEVIKPVAVGDDTPSKNQLRTDIGTILNWVIGSLGLVAVIVIIIGGINYMTSSGDAGKVDKAKKTILYGVIGLIICAVAAAIVNFVIGMINDNTGTPSCEEGKKLVDGECVSV